MGVIIAISLVSGSFIAVDSSALGRLRAALEEVEVDFTGNGYLLDEGDMVTPADYEAYSSLADELMFVDNVEEVCPMAVMGDVWICNSEGQQYYSDWGYSEMVFLPEDSDRLLDSYMVSGEMPGPGEAAVPSIIADSLSLTVGDTVICSRQFYKGSEYVDGVWVSGYYWVNISLTVSDVWSQSSEYESDYYWWGWDDPGAVEFAGHLNPVVASMDDLGAVIGLLSEEGSEYYYISSTFFVWIDRDAVINLANIPGSIQRLDFISGRLDRVASPSGITIYGGALSDALLSTNAELQGMRTVFFGLSLPVIVLGAYLSFVGVDLGVSQRRREVGILKSRGANNRQVFASLMVESLVLGGLAGLGGLLGGVLVSRLLLDATVRIGYGSSGNTELGDIIIGSGTIVSSLIFGILLMVASAYRPLKRAAKTPASEALHYYVRKDTTIAYKARWDVAALLLVSLSFLSSLVDDPWDLQIGGSFVVNVVIMILWGLGITIVPLVPFLLSASLARVFTRGPGMLYTRFTGLFKPWTKELHYIVDKNIRRNPRRASNMAIIISLAVAFGLFISITTETWIGNAMREMEYNVGADINISGYTSWNGTEPSANLSMLDTLDEIDGVAQSVRYYRTSTYDGSLSITDVGAYDAVVDPESFWFVEGGLGDLQEPGTAMMSEQYADDNYFVVGDVIVVDCYSYSVYDVELEVVGIFKGLPGIGWTNLLTDIGTFASQGEEVLLNGEVGVLIDVGSGGNDLVVAAEASELYEDAGVYVYSERVLEKEKEELFEDDAFSALTDFLYTEYALSFVIMSLGIGLVIFVTVSDRERELACIMARGASGWQMRRILMGESLSLMSMGLIVGVGVGFLSAWMFNRLVWSTGGSEFDSVLIVNWVTWTIVLASIGSFLLASVLATMRAGKIKLAEVLRIRGG